MSFISISILTIVCEIINWYVLSHATYIMSNIHLLIKIDGRVNIKNKIKQKKVKIKIAKTKTISKFKKKRQT